MEYLPQTQDNHTENNEKNTKEKQLHHEKKKIQL